MESSRLLADSAYRVQVDTGGSTARFTHTNPIDRRQGIFGGDQTLYGGGVHQSHLLLPVIP